VKGQCAHDTWRCRDSVRMSSVGPASRRSSTVRVRDRHVQAPHMELTHPKQTSFSIGRARGRAEQNRGTDLPRAWHWPGPGTVNRSSSHREPPASFNLRLIFEDSACVCAPIMCGCGTSICSSVLHRVIFFIRLCHF
jgi:hypothetical protein